MKVFTIRTKEGKPIIFDESVQVQPNGECIELHFTEKRMAKSVLKYLKKDNPKQEFVLYQETISEENIVFEGDTEFVHQKALEEKEKNKIGGCC